MKSYQELKKIAESQGYYGSVQFPIYLKNGGIIFQDPDLMEQPNGFPVLNTKKYVATHHPEHLSEVETHQQQVNKMLDRLDNEVKKTKKNSWFW